MMRNELTAQLCDPASLWYAGEYTRCLEHLSADPPSAANALLAARCHYRLRRYDAALDALRQGEPYFQPGETAQEALALAALLQAINGNFEVSNEYLARLDDTPSARISVRARVEIAHMRALCAWMRNDLIEAEALLAGCGCGPDLNAQARGKMIRAYIRQKRGKPAEQAALLVEGYQLLKRASLPDVGLMAAVVFALASMTRELYIPDVAAIVEEALTTLPWTEDLAMERFQTLRRSAWAQALQANYIPAIRRLHTAREVAPSRYFETLARFDRAWVSRVAGERATYEAEATAAADIALELDWTQPNGEEAATLLVGAELLAEIDVTLAQTLLLRFEQAQAHISHAMAMCRDPYLTALAGVAKAAISAARNDVNGVRRAAKAAFDVYDGLGMQWRAGWCAVMLYRAGCGNEWLRVAKNCVESYPRSFIAEEIGRLEHRQCQSHNPDLTARQREIFALLMDGRTIDEIADLLSCSRNTVRIHVGAVYRKLGVRNRVELLTQVAT